MQEKGPLTAAKAVSSSIVTGTPVDAPVPCVSHGLAPPSEATAFES